jgi:phosphatidylserine/phosphatidylglycerophosphate/cardiolipin synthase-like enzyme
LKETTAKQRGTIRVHTKAIVIDVTSEAPIIISGSHNFSTNASKNNDENYLILRRDLEVADVYLCEILRIYDHYRFRFSAKEKAKAGEPTAPPALVGDNSWAEPYFTDGNLKSLDRIRFSGR